MLMVKIKRITSIILVFILLFSCVHGTVFADDSLIAEADYANTHEGVIDGGNVGDNAFWELNEDGTLTVFGAGDLFCYSTQADTPWYRYRDEVKHLEINDGIESTHGVSFENYINLEDVKMADTVLSLPSSFRNCISLKEISFSAGLISIPDGCFEGCIELQQIFIPKNIISVGSYAFRYCEKLADIDFEEGYIEFGRDVFSGTAAYSDTGNVKDGFLFIDNCLFSEISAAEGELILGPEITSIAAGWYKIPDSAVTVLTVYNPLCVFPSESFAVLYGGNVLKGPDGSTAQRYSEKFGIKFESLCICEDTRIIPESTGLCDGTEGYTEGVWCDLCQNWVSGHEKKAEFFHIDKNADEICDHCKDSTKTVIISAGKCGEHISWRITEDYVLYFDGTGEMTSFSDETSPWKAYSEEITSVFISDGITSVGDYAFYNCKNIETVTFSTVLTDIGDYAFYGCGRLTDIIFPETLYSVGERAFYGCCNIKSIIIPEAVSVLGKGIFEECNTYT